MRPQRNKRAITPNALLCVSLFFLSAAFFSTSAEATRAAVHRGQASRRAHKHAHAGCLAHSSATLHARSASRPRAHVATRACHKAAAKDPNAKTKVSPTKPVRTATTEPISSSAPTPPSAQEAAATIAAVLNTPCQNTELTPEAANLPLVRAAVFCLINRERAADGRLPLAANAQLEEAAEGHTQELVQDDYFAHVTPGGETPVDRIRATGYIPGPSVGYVIGENLAWGTYALGTPQAIVTAWMSSPGHRANILEGQYTETGIGVTPAVPASLGEGQPGATFAQEFAVIKE